MDSATRLVCPGCSERHRLILESLREALRVVHPSRSIPRHVRIRDSEVIAGARRLEARRGLYVIGFGKASSTMARALYELLGDRIESGVVIAPRGMGGRIGPIEVLEGDHPVPGDHTLRASVKLLEFASSIPRDASVIVLVSGGGSALFEVPEEGLTLGEVSAVTRELLLRGADIYELNTVRKHLSRVKGGKLLRVLKAQTIVNLVMSDVPGDNPSFVASGPALPDESTCRDALRILEEYGVVNLLPQRVLSRLKDPNCPYETLKPGSEGGKQVDWVIIARNLDALGAVERVLKRSGVDAVTLTDTLRGEAREVAKVLASLAEASFRGLSRSEAIIAGGETTVTVRGSGQGGRNQELCLALALALKKLGIVKRYIAACMGTDGVDGTSPVAGAMVDESVVPEARRLGLNPEAYLQNNDSYGFFSRLGRIIDTGGYTGVNVNDIFVMLVNR